ncbi:hypothetical protein KP803_11805 [Vibrio sp. ZSDE26]|uniref:Uncharacterized protein n=1 Tax=Vibrio amylolyticus TaxID=2847292 RepID=A0A9X1XKQ7_9VIBR|nr:hypothetical protein [Vibrio amylolyticus]MCK6263955.1 hypothetical protein [Vibrio amylolyticus]
MGKSWVLIGVAFIGYYSFGKFNDHMNNVVLASSNDYLQKLHQHVMCDNKPDLTFFESLTSTKASWALRERGRVDLAMEVSMSCK